MSSLEYPITVDMCSGVTSGPPQQEAAEPVSAAPSDGPQQDAAGLVPIEIPSDFATLA
jgi:hypothetical protein